MAECSALFKLTYKKLSKKRDNTLDILILDKNTFSIRDHLIKPGGHRSLTFGTAVVATSYQNCFRSFHGRSKLEAALFQRTRPSRLMIGIWSPGADTGMHEMAASLTPSDESMLTKKETQRICSSAYFWM